jgi:ssDNA thymidine ADP-ribosyltransferase, DarT
LLLGAVSARNVQQSHIEPPFEPMADDYAQLLNPERARIFRIIHRANLSWVLENGLHCGNGKTRSAHWVSIGNQELISKRAYWPVPVAPGGVLNDYVPFYFTPFSPMMLNIRTGWNGVQQHPLQDILILVSNLQRVDALGLNWLFTDTHANNGLARYFTRLEDLSQIDWRILQARDFRRDPDDPGKVGRYQAEALVHRHCPVEGISGVVCYDEAGKIGAEKAMVDASLSLPVEARPRWYV